VLLAATDGHRLSLAEVRREVWTRDGGRCAFIAGDGRRCNSRWKLELDHIHPEALGGTSTVDNLPDRVPRAQPARS
jgi:5-methylcytosine-specific restriction endonuclease McrA